MENAIHPEDPPPAYSSVVDLPELGSSSNISHIRYQTVTFHNIDPPTGTPKPPPYSYNTPYQLGHYQNVSLESLPPGTLQPLCPSYDVRVVRPGIPHTEPPPMVFQPEQSQAEFSAFWYILLGSFVMLGFGFFFGFFAILLAVFASQHAAQGDRWTAHLLATVSLGISIAGILLGVVVYSVLLSIYL